ncbi:2-hydroxyacid dehydrogenase [Mycobacterium antarcticum]|uniref:D-2-hydroxyacid dehydrogenase family protein n=1 Tax=unclassified Mycolicibacterium TaxID=2636767 RepID=UPI002388F63C|nr:MULTISPECIES: D-2-hydroxyacid dehydrogenase family protein [unclassified Mycolicibacterium]BDX29593.1 2-hydroxyacid dehydrogenase [Mycolicibacterium sp. TUM20985]GLP78739.1 2-hydroxyacid dehydrogenase [Mycolicibacterium sp. TUM20984]
MSRRIQVAVLDDYQDVALSLADWSPVTVRADVTVFNDHVADPDELVARLTPFDVVFLMRERTPLPRNVLERLPRLRMIASTGNVNASIDMAAVADLGIHVSATGGSIGSTVELTWALILATARHLVAEREAVAEGRWQTTVGRELDRRVLGVLGVGRIGARVARIGAAFGMDVVAWSQNLTPEAAGEVGARHVTRAEFFATADVVTIHLKLSERSRGLVGAAELAAMKSTALLVNTSRGPIVDEAALIAALRSGSIAGAGLDVFDVEPLPAHHPFRTMANVTATPHLGYVADRPYRIFFRDAVAAIAEWLDGFG